MVRQIDILMRANEYLSKLNNGIDPLSGEGLPDYSAAKEENVRKLFFFCSKNLVRIITYDDTDNRPAFFLTPEQAARLRPADGSIGLAKLCERINRAADLLRCRGLSGFTLGNWLVRRGYLWRGQGRSLEPTESGRAIGLSSAGGEGLKFDQNAQQYVIDHIQELLGFVRKTNGEGKPSRMPIKDSGIIMSNIASMRRLSGGMHPYKDAPLAGRDPLTQERLRKCFDYTAWAMERSAKAGYFTAKSPFTLPQERWKEIAISNEPVAATEFAKAVNSLLPDPTAVKGLAPVVVRDYLVSKGLLQTVRCEGGRKRMIPTPVGKAAGVEMRETVDRNGRPFTGVFYGAEAQQYLVEHFGELIELAWKEWER